MIVVVIEIFYYYLSNLAEVPGAENVGKEAVPCDILTHLHPLLCLRKIPHFRPNCSLTHCNKNPNYVFLLWELRGLSPNFHIHLSVSDLYIFQGSVHIFPAAK
jgi:hypothetical protein